ncbi:hypothetical protein IFM89_032042 [Coptis chinensis]|uniref:DUF913 domain-containing protein n=1 Tax=Coptis chinensis TaxID=261450 RepID=A0A835GZF5_9MAGN|nr:hypothetical protein IFM89_032042 [Coptis chinensis]
MVPEKIRILSTLALVALCQDRSRQQGSGVDRYHIRWAPWHSTKFHAKTIDSITGDYSKCSIVFSRRLSVASHVFWFHPLSLLSRLHEAGLIPTLLPLLKDTNPNIYIWLVIAVHVLEAFMDYSNPKKCDRLETWGLDDTIARLKIEVCYIESGSEKSGVKTLIVLVRENKLSMLRLFSPVPMETDAKKVFWFQLMGNFQRWKLGTNNRGISDGSLANIESFLHECINNAARLLETILRIADTYASIFIDKKGIEAVLQLFTLPLMPLTFSGLGSISVAFGELFASTFSLL